MLDLLPALMLIIAAVCNLAWLMISWQSTIPTPVPAPADPVPKAALETAEAVRRSWRADLARAWAWLMSYRLGVGVVVLGLATVVYVLLITPPTLIATGPGQAGHPFQGLRYVRKLELSLAGQMALVLAVIGTIVSLGLFVQTRFWRPDADRSGIKPRAGMLVAGLCLLGLGQLALLGFYPRSPVNPFLPALIILGIWAFAYTPHIRLDLFSSTWPRWREVLMLALALGLTAFARFYRLSIYPYGIEGDESKWTIEVIGVMFDGTYPVSADLHMAVVPVSFYMQAPFHYLLGPSILSARVAVAFYSVLGSLCFYLLVRAITNPPIAWLATVLLAVSLLDMGASRLGNVESHVKLWPLLALALLAPALRTRRLLLYGLSGVAVAVGLLTYETVSPILGVTSLIILYELIRRREPLVESIRQISAFSAPILAVAPIVVAYQVGRLDYYLDYASGGNVREGNVLGGLWLNFTAVLHTLFVAMKTDFLYNRMGPLFNSLLLPALVFGTVLALFHWRHGRLLWVVLFTGLFFFPVPMLTHAPLGRVYYPGLASAYLLMAIGIYAAYRELERALVPALRPAFSMLAGVGLTILIVCNMYIYFNEVFDTLDRLYRRELYDAALAAAGPNTKVYFPFVPDAGDPAEIEQQFIIPLGMRKPDTRSGEVYPYEVLPLPSLLPALTALRQPYQQIEVIWDKDSPGQRAERDAILTNLLQCYPGARQVSGRRYDRYVIPGAALRTPACTP